MSTTNKLRLRRETSSVGDAFAAAETSNGHAGQAGTGLRSWRCWRRRCTPAAGPPTSTRRLGASHACSCKTLTTARSAAHYRRIRRPNW